MQSPPSEQVRAGQIAAGAVKLGIELCQQTIDGVRLDREIEAYIRDEGGTPALKGYRPAFSLDPYQWTICLARNNEAVHGPPIKLIGSENLVTIDLVVEVGGWHADTARTFTRSSDLAMQQFVEISKLIFEAGLEAIAPQQPINLFGMMVESAAKLQGYGIVREFCGHGIGKTIHNEPQVLNYSTPTAEVFEIGRAYAVEPVLAIENQYELKKGQDGWTASANCLTSHNEDTIFVGRNGIINLTGDPS